MATKEEYEKALKEMNDAFYGITFLNSQTRRFDDNLNLLHELVNEHFEEKAETNYEHFKDEIIQNVKYALAVVNGEPKPCADTNCDECEFKESGKCVERVIEWLNKQHKKPTFKLSQFEYDLIQTYRDCNKYCKLSDRRILQELKDKGYFMDVDYDTKIQDILANCEVIK